MPYALSSVTASGQSPYVAACVACLVAVLFALIGDIGLVASVTDFSVYAIFVAVNISLIVLRFRAPNAARSFVSPFAVGRVPILPILGIAAVILMVANLEWHAWLIGLGIILAGVLLWTLLAAFRPYKTQPGV